MVTQYTCVANCDVIITSCLKACNKIGSIAYWLIDYVIWCARYHPVNGPSSINGAFQKWVWPEVNEHQTMITPLQRHNHPVQRYFITLYTCKTDPEQITS